MIHKNTKSHNVIPAKAGIQKTKRKTKNKRASSRTSVSEVWRSHSDAQKRDCQRIGLAMTDSVCFFYFSGSQIKVWDDDGNMVESKIILDNLSSSDDVSITHEDGVLYYILYGFANAKKKIAIHLTKEGTEANILGVLIGSEKDCSISSFQHHQAPNTKSDLLIKAILAGDAKFSYKGKIRIEKDAQHSNAYQRNENIMVGDRAYVDTRPELEILANDVRCTHGATIGKVDEEALFYLQSRGLSRNEATALILRGFTESILDRIPDDKARQKIADHVAGELQKVIIP